MITKTKTKTKTNTKAKTFFFKLRKKKLYKKTAVQMHSSFSRFCIMPLFYFFCCVIEDLQCT